MTALIPIRKLHEFDNAHMYLHPKKIHPPQGKRTMYASTPSRHLLPVLCERFADVIEEARIYCYYLSSRENNIITLTPVPALRMSLFGISSSPINKKQKSSEETLCNLKRSPVKVLLVCITDYQNVKPKEMSPHRNFLLFI